MAKIDTVLSEIYALQGKRHKISKCALINSVTIECYRTQINWWVSGLRRIDGVYHVSVCRDIFKYAHVTAHIDKSIEWSN